LQAQPEAGHLFKIDLSADGIRGVPAPVFGKGIIQHQSKKILPTLCQDGADKKHESQHQIEK
jgi:hypothetical protein